MKHRGARTLACRVETHLDARAARKTSSVEMSLDAARMSACATGVSRRRWLAGALALAGCGSKKIIAHPAQVSIVRAPAYDQTLYDIVRRMLAEHRLHVRGRNVVLKPNLVEFEPGSSINTHPLIVHAAYEAFIALGAASVRIAEGPGHRRNTLDLADAAGYFQLVPRFEEIFTDLNIDDVSRVELPRQVSRLGKLYLPNTALGADLLVSMPKMKTHHWAGATLSLKNLFGTVPGGLYGWPKNVLHWGGIDESIADLRTAFPRQFALVDGIIGMEGNGPIQGQAEIRGRAGGRARHGRGGCHLLPHHADRTLEAGLFEVRGGRGRADWRARYPSNGRDHRERGYAV